MGDLVDLILTLTNQRLHSPFLPPSLPQRVIIAYIDDQIIANFPRLGRDW